MIPKELAITHVHKGGFQECRIALSALPDLDSLRIDMA
jgi:hypothetical protein